LTQSVKEDAAVMKMRWTWTPLSACRWWATWSEPPAWCVPAARFCSSVDRQTVSSCSPRGTQAGER